MADGFVFKPEHDNPSDCPGTSADLLSSLFQRRMDFHPARKSFNGFDNGGGDFRFETLNPSSSLAHKSGSNVDHSASKGKKMDGSELLENGLDPELSFEITFRRIGAGLQNLGNTCFLNSVLQCLTYTEPLAAYLQSGKHQNSCHVAGFCALCAIQKHVSRALQSSGRILAPKDLVSNLRCISRNFRNARQEDAHEYMVNLLESMHRCCLPLGLPSESPSAYEKSLVHKIFGGRLRSQVKCMQCSYCSNTFDPFLDLSLDIVKADSIYKAFKNFTTPELLDGGERQYQCQRCKQKVKALKQFTVHKAPYVLTIHLKRFQSYNLEEKIHKKIQFGPTLDLKPFVSGSYADGDLKYTLYGVLVHHGGSTRSGHYYCYVRTSSGMWYALDDNRVSHVGDRTVFEQQAYMLFYVRDRRKVVQKKSIDIALKENMKMSTSSNRSDSVVNQGLKDNCAQNCTFEKKLNGPTSDELRKESKDSPNMGPSKTKISNGPSVQIEIEQASTECSVPVTVSMPTYSSRGVLPLKTFSEDIMPNSSPAEDLTSLPVCMNNNFVATNSVSSLARAADIEIGHVNRGLGVLVATSLNLIDPNTSAIPQANGNAALTEESGCKTLEKSYPEILPDQPKSESSKVDIPNQKFVGNLSSEDASDCKKLMPDESNKMSTSSIMTSELLVTKTPDSKHGRRLKRKNLKYHLGSLHLSSNILFKASLSLCKKRKHKRKKRQSAGSKNLTEESLSSTDGISSDLGPSTSEKAKSIYLVSTCKSRKKAKHGSREGNGISTKNEAHNVEELTDIVDKGSGKRSKEESSELATKKKLNCSSDSIIVANHKESIEVNFPKDRKINANQDGFRCVLTNGFQNTVVEQWDGTKMPSFENGFSGMETIRSIGYVADEWDEEYDQGKRKKIREFKHSFGGPNPFQEIATKKSQFKKLKLDRSGSAKEPFRI
ncbi:ubiquitin carboxyl-terminal hydrolase 23 isoform X2 [Momordica charantia]|uniref:Ubiquitin carboxyl-terminal hydrolase n=1 Tax=Momordica charantia TaxID=3673 RepID=A0A6J1DWF7_MOMCH|nr:ubiquitin carboxyl-terminal hydrolase 23 isoform X2 [Momordica charantia]